MEIQPAHFEASDIRAHAMGAGVIPVASHPETGEPHLLLGRERWLASWKGSCRWSGFEGSRKDGEDIDATAAREFAEESLGVVMDAEATARRIRARDFWVRIVLRVHHERRPAERYHSTYLVPVSWDAETPRRFQDARLAIERADRLAQEWRHTRPELLGEAGTEVGPIAALADEAGGGAVVRRPRAAAPCVVGAPWTVDPEDSELIRAEVRDPARAAALLAWEALRVRLEALPAHPAVAAQRDGRWGRVQEVAVSRDHLEKDQVRWWSATELRAVVAARGQHGTHRFRPYFMPVLQTALAELQRAPPPSGVTPPRSPPAPAPPAREGTEAPSESPRRWELVRR